MKLVVTFTLFLISSTCFAKLSIMTTTTNLASVAKFIGGEKVEVESLCKGTQDPHFLEAKPSYTFKLSKADLLISIGADLEVGWLPLIIRGSHNPKLREGQIGHLVASSGLELIEKITGDLTRSDGDVHPAGNPHFMLSPNMALIVASSITKRLSVIDNTNQSYYEENLASFKFKTNTLINDWKKKLKSGLKVVSHHRTLSYLFKDFAVNNIDYLEPKPGIPPTSSHVISLINKIKEQKVQKIILENYFNDSVAKRVKHDISGLEIYSVPVAVEGEKGIDDIFKLYNRLLKVLESDLSLFSRTLF